MALRVWLPLNGNTNNYGISDLTFTNTSTSNTTSSASGKIGSCYTNNSNTAGGLLSNQTINLGSKQSMCCWVKFNSFYSSASLTGIGGQHRYYDKAPSNMGLTAKYLSATTGKLSVNTAVGTSRTYNTYCGNTTLNSGTWYHVAYTYDGTTISLYVNGILDGTFNIPNMVVKADYIHLFSWSSSGASDKAIHGDYKLNGSLNDFRVYDHCLSPKEVKEISKGLVLHYKLTGPGGINHFKGYTGNGQELRLNDYPATSGSFTQFYNCLDFDPATTIGKQYTISFWAKSPNGSSPLSLYNANGNPRYFYYSTSLGTVDTEWKFYKYNFTNTDRGSSYSAGTHPVEIYASSKMGVLVKHIKVEEGSVATPWCPNPSDALYSALGYNSNIEDDYSSYCRNGIKSGTITWDVDSPRYATSYKFGSTSTKIKATNFGMSGFANSYSFAWWQKNTSSGNMPWGFSDGNRLNLYHTTNLCWNTGDGGSNPFKDSSGTAIPNTRLCDSTWHHCVITGNGSTTKLYIDGIYAGAATTYKAITGTQIYISGWDTSTSYTFSGSNLSDFRIYATTLSDADVLELYNTSLSIDNVGNMYTYEFKEIE